MAAPSLTCSGFSPTAAAPREVGSGEVGELHNFSLPADQIPAEVWDVRLVCLIPKPSFIQKVCGVNLAIQLASAVLYAQLPHCQHR